MHKCSAVLLWLYLASSAGSTASGAVIAEFTGGDVPSGFPAFYGLAFTTPAGQSFSNIRFSFYSDFPATTPYAIGTAFLMAIVVPDTPADLNAIPPEFAVTSIGISNGQYVFPTSLALDPNTPYFVFVDTEIPAGAITGAAFGAPLGVGLFFSPAPTIPYIFAEGASANFRVTGDVVIPEPGTLLLLGSTLGVLWILRTVRATRGNRTPTALARQSG